MGCVFSLIFANLLCPLALLFAGMMPFGAASSVRMPTTLVGTVQPTSATTTAASIQISADATEMQVGDTVTLTGVPVNIGIPYYTLTLSCGAQVTVTYYNELRDALDSDAQFEIISAVGEMNRVVFTLRALAPGTVRAAISATGEVRTPEGVFMWGGGMSEELELVVSE